jgi:3,4-dihydroxy 2-butanone 4-phosphate synthase/GTP cyclohydrolase II
VLQRVGHTEAAVDSAGWLASPPVLCEILADDGHMRRRAEDASSTLTFILWPTLSRIACSTSGCASRGRGPPLDIGGEGWRIVWLPHDVDARERCPSRESETGDVLVRMHSKCLTGDVFHSRRCDCGWQLHTAMETIAREGRGVVVYLDQEGRGIGLVNKLKAYELQDEGHDTVEANEKLGFKADLRNYGIGAQILLDLGLRSIRVLTNNPMKLVGLNGYGLRLVDRVRLSAPETDDNAGYLEAKRTKLGHLLSH